MKCTQLLMVCSLAAASLPVSAAELLSDNFESYADTAALEAAWVPSEAGYLALTTNAGQGATSSDKYVVMPADFNPISTGSDPYSWRAFSGGATHSPTNADPIVFSVYCRSASWGGSRARVGVRSSATSGNILDLGTNNGTGDDKFLCRVVGWGTAPGYVIFLSGPNRSANTWYKLEVSAGDTAFSFKVDNTAITETATATAAPTTALGGVRFGAGVSANATVDWDNILVSTNASAVSDWDLY